MKNVGDVIQFPDASVVVACVALAHEVLDDLPQVAPEAIHQPLVLGNRGQFERVTFADEFHIFSQSLNKEPLPLDELALIFE